MKDRRRSRWWLLLLVLPLIGGAILIRARRQAIESVPPPDAAPWAVRTAIVERAPVRHGYPVLATVSASQEITVTSQVSGTLLEMGPREGVRVRRGDLLARIDVSELSEKRKALAARTDAARAEAKRAEDEQVREESLFREGGSSATELEGRRTAALAARQNVRSLERELRALDVRLGFGEIRATVDGVVAARLAEPGDVCLPGHPIYRLTAAQGARVRVRVPQKVLERIHPGTPIDLTHGTGSMRIEVSRVYPALGADALGAAEADLLAPPFGQPSGARLTARVVLDELQDALLVPDQALLRGDNTETARVFKVESDAKSVTRVMALPVAVRLDAGDRVAVDGDLEAGDQVVVGHQRLLLTLREGDAVRIVSKVAP